MPDIIPSKILSITRAQPQTVYDIQTARNHNFIANGHIVSNSIVFQEQTMLIAEKVAGMPPDECDSFRRTLTKRSMVKKDSATAEFEALKDKFVDGCMTQSGLTREKSVELFDKLRYFSGYAFNKSMASDTLVKIYSDADGQHVTTKPIFTVEPGTYVRTRSEQAHEQDYVRVTANHDHGEQMVFRIELDDGSDVVCTLDHKFRVADDRMLPVWQIMKEDLEIVSDKNV